MSVFNITPQSTDNTFPLSAWLRATSAGQPGTVPLGKNTLNSAEFKVFPLESGRALLWYRDSSGYPTVQIGTLTPSVGTAVTMLSSSVTLDAFCRVADTNNFLFCMNNDVYLVQCGLSGTTVTVTLIVTDAGDVGRAEAFVENIPYIEAAEDGTHFIIANQFNDGGTYKFVTAVWALALTNLFARSQQLDDASWTKLNTTVSANVTTAPDGSTTADKLVETATTGRHYILRNINVTNGLQYTVSIYAKISDTRDSLIIDGVDGFVGAGNYCTFNLTTQTVVNSGNATGSITDVGSGWYRCAATFTAISTGSASIVFELGSNFAGYAGDITKGMWLWGAQAEPSSVATPYQQTQSVAAPTAPYVGRDTDATGRNAAFGVAAGCRGSTQGTSLYVGTDVGATTTVYCNKITYNTTSVTNSVNTIATTNVMSSISGSGEKYAGWSDSDNDLMCFSWRTPSVKGAFLSIDFSGTPTKLVETEAPSLGINRGASENIGNSLVFAGSSSGAVTTAVGLQISFPGAGVVHTTQALATGLTATASIGSVGVDAGGDYVFVLGEQGTNAGQLFVFKHADA